VVADELLARLRAAIGVDVDYAEEPVKLGGGFYTANYRFALKATEGWTEPMVLRLFPKHAPEDLDAWEAAVQTFACDRGVLAPAVVLREDGSTIEERRWFVMQMLPGSPAMAGISTRQLARNVGRIYRDMPRQTAEVHLALHRLDPAPLVDAFGDAATIERWWSQIARPISGQVGSHPLVSGVEWLRQNQPEPRAPLALCHGDSWGGNILIDSGQVTGLIDWSVATVAEPALDVGFLTAALSLAPVPAPRPIQRTIRRVSRRLAIAYRSVYESGSNADLASVPYYEALRCLLELNGVVRYRTTLAAGLEHDGPRPTWDGIADDMVVFFEDRTGVRLEMPAPVH
jgi:aminoglycoside phosphotransferase (APT) family kinase protein